MDNIFEKGVITSKIGFVFLLVILAFINGHGDYVGKKPKLFMINNMVIAFTMCLSTWFIAWNRRSKASTKVFIMFLFAFFFQVCRELSGYYTFTGDEEVISDIEKMEKKSPSSK
ncbi:MAG: hypothetical protein WCG31_11920 [Deltaproteobacteria bacterium]